MTRRRRWQLGLAWAVLSSIGAGVGFAIGQVVAIVVGVSVSLFTILFLGTALGAQPPSEPASGIVSSVSWLLTMTLAVGAVGATVGPIVGAIQAGLLRWYGLPHGQWLTRSLLGWSAGGALGGLLVAAMQIQLAIPPAPTVEIATAVLGLVLGVVLRSALPGPVPSLLWWLPAHVAAASGGWIAWYFIYGPTWFVVPAWERQLLGGVVYGVVSSLAILRLTEAQASAATTEAPPSDPA